MISLLPFTTDPSQSVTVQLPSGTYDFDVRWNERAQLWSFSITDNVTQTLLAANIAIVLGCELLAPYGLGIGYMLAFAEDGLQIDAAFDDLGVRINVYALSADVLA